MSVNEIVCQILQVLYPILASGNSVNKGVSSLLEKLADKLMSLNDNSVAFYMTNRMTVTQKTSEMNNAINNMQSKKNNFLEHQTAWLSFEDIILKCYN